MIVVQLAGGLGNQMFEYAAGRRLAIARGVDLRLDPCNFGPDGDRQAAGLEGFARHVKLTQFNVAATLATPADVAAVRDPWDNTRLTSRFGRRVLRRLRPGLAFPATHVNERQYRFDPAVLDLPDPCYLVGLWQSWRYFADVADAVRTDLTPRDPAVAAYARDYVADVRARCQGKPVVSVHVRRGELAHAQDVLKNTHGTFGPPTRLEYVRQAMARFDPASHAFLVFSDTPKDIDWCKANVAGDGVSYAEGHTDVQDLVLQSACDHHIVASTFSWWSAWLGTRPGKRIVAPRQWGHAGGPMVPDDLVPPEWELIG